MVLFPSLFYLISLLLWCSFLVAELSTAIPVQHAPRQSNQALLRILPLGASITMGLKFTDQNGYRKALRDKLRHEGWEVNMVGTKSDGTMADNV